MALEVAEKHAEVSGSAVVPSRVACGGGSGDAGTAERLMAPGAACRAGHSAVLAVWEGTPAG